MNRKRIGLLHGAILNSGDFLIFNRGKRLLMEYLDHEYELVDIERWKPIHGEFDALIILGGPLISRKLHPQSKVINDYLKRDIPVICLGLGISGERYNGEENYFTPQSTEFWRHIYQSSHLFSVRDKKTAMILKRIGIDAEFTGCPALYDLDVIKNREATISGTGKSEGLNNEIAVTIPQIQINTHPVSVLAGIRNIILTFTFLHTLRASTDVRSYQLILQHGYTPSLKLIGRYAASSGFKVVDASGRGLDGVEEMEQSEIHIGTRLHSHIFFLSQGKPSYLLSIDNRTRAFMGSFNWEVESFSLTGINRLLNKFSEEIESPEKLEKNTKNTNKAITDLYPNMESFLTRVDGFLDTI